MFRWINGRDPRQYGLDFGLWTRSVVAELIERKFAIRLGVTAVGELLAKLGLTPQKPLQRAYQRDPEAIEAWQRERFPAIARQAKASGGEVYFWDELGFRADSVHGKTWGKKGQTPVVERPGQRQSISAASAVNARGGFWYCTYQGGLNAELFVSLLRRMMRRRSKPVHLVLDGLPAHKTTLVKTYVASTKGMLTLHFLPGYAPELNPDELVWSHMKRTGVARTPLRRGEKLQAKIEAQLSAIKRMPRLIRSFFKAPSVGNLLQHLGFTRGTHAGDRDDNAGDHHCPDPAEQADGRPLLLRNFQQLSVSSRPTVADTSRFKVGARVPETSFAFCRAR